MARTKQRTKSQKQKRAKERRQKKQNEKLIKKIDASIEELEYEEAREFILIALARKSLTDDQNFHVNMQAGVVQRILGHDVEASMHFRDALALRPEASLPDTMAPKITTFFAMVKRQSLREQGSMPVDGTSSKKSIAKVAEKVEQAPEQVAVAPPKDDAQEKRAEPAPDEAQYDVTVLQEDSAPNPESTTSEPVLFEDEETQTYGLWAVGSLGLLTAVLVPVLVGLSAGSYFGIVAQEALNPNLRQGGRALWVGSSSLAFISAVAALVLGFTTAAVAASSTLNPATAEPEEPGGFSITFLLGPAALASGAVAVSGLGASLAAYFFILTDEKSNSALRQGGRFVWLGGAGLALAGILATAGFAAAAGVTWVLE